MIRLPLTACALLLAAASARAAAPFQEDLSAVTLPHGDLILPLPGTLEAGNGTYLKFSDAHLHPLPTNNGQPLPPAAIPAAMQAQKTADLAFLDSDNGTLWAISGFISELGTTYLADAAAMKLDPPLELPADKTHPAGLLKGIYEGRTYLVQDLAGKFALVRIIEITPSVGAHIQYVYQPDGTTRFAIPHTQVDSAPVVPLLAPLAPNALPGPAAPSAAVAPLGSPAPALAAALNAQPPGNLSPLPPTVATPPTGSADLLTAPDVVPAKPKSLTGMTLRMTGSGDATPGIEPDINTFIHQRDAMVQSRLKAITAAASTPAEITKKSQEISELGALRAPEAADALAAQVSFLDPFRQTKDSSPESIHPAYAALLSLGKPGADAALKALRALDLAAPSATTEFTDTPDYRAHLLALVIRTVDGDDVAEFLFKKEMSRTPDPKKRALFQSLVGSP